MHYRHVELPSQVYNSHHSPTSSIYHPGKTLNTSGDLPRPQKHLGGKERETLYGKLEIITFYSTYLYVKVAMPPTPKALDANISLFTLST